MIVGRRSSVVGLAFALGLLILPAPASAQHQVVRSAPFDRDGSFRVWNLAGSVRIVGWDRDSVRVEADMDDVARSVFLFGGDGAGGKLTTEQNGRSGVAHIVLYLPREATVWVKTLSAPVDVEGVSGSIDVYAVTGDVTIDASATTVYAESMGGHVRVAGRSRVVRLRTGSGAIDFDGGADDLALTTVSGDILARASGVMRGIVESVGGRVHLGLSFGHDATLEVLTHDGAVDITLPAHAPVDFSISTVSGEVVRRGGRQSVRGGAEVELRTFSGDITLRRAP